MAHAFCVWELCFRRKIDIILVRLIPGMCDIQLAYVLELFTEPLRGGVVQRQLLLWKAQHSMVKDSWKVHPWKSLHKVQAAKLMERLPSPAIITAYMIWRRGLQTFSTFWALCVSFFLVSWVLLSFLLFYWCEKVSVSKVINKKSN